MKLNLMTTVAALAFGVSAAVAEEVRVYNWSDYIDEGLLEKATELLEVDKTIVHDRLRKLMEEDAVGPVARRTSSRLITILTGLPALRDRASATGSMKVVVLPPKPPPISDDVTRS